MGYDIVTKRYVGNYGFAGKSILIESSVLDKKAYNPAFL